MSELNGHTLRPTRRIGRLADRDRVGRVADPIRNARDADKDYGKYPIRLTRPWGRAARLQIWTADAADVRRPDTITQDRKGSVRGGSFSDHRAPARDAYQPLQSLALAQGRKCRTGTRAKPRTAVIFCR